MKLVVYLFNSLNVEIKMNWLISLKVLFSLSKDRINLNQKQSRETF